MNMENISKDDLFPSLLDLVRNNLTEFPNMDFSKLSLAIYADAQDRLFIPRREDIAVVYEDKSFEWHNDSIRALFRGNHIPPDLKEYPPEYDFFFYRIESQIILLSEHLEHELCDVDFEEIFSAMRRRPDGRRINLMHDVVWQAASLNMALSPCSESEYTAIFMRLEQSARTFNLGRSSKNYLSYLRDELSDF